MDKFEKLFHIRKDRGNRLIPLCPVIDDKNVIHDWIEHDGELIEILPTDLVESHYFSKKPVSETDIFFSFMNFMFQKCTRGDLFPILGCIINDMHNLSTCLKKVEIYHKLKEDKTLSIDRFVITEIEYIFGVCRSLFDLFQKIAKKTWDGIRLLDTSIKKNELKDSFSNMCLSGDKIRSKNELQEKYGLSPLWAEFYEENALFFQKIRKFRNEVEHHGITPKIIFVTEQGFAIQSSYEHFRDFGVWREETFLNNNLAPIKPIIAFVIKNTLGAMGKFVNILSNEFKYPEDIAPGYFLFMRGANIHKLAELDEYIEKKVWYNV